MNTTARKVIQELLSRSSPEEVYQMVLDGTISKFPQYFWSMPENYYWASICTRYLIERVLEWDRETVCKKLTTSVIFKYKLRGMAETVFKSNLYDIVNNAYPNQFLPWELKSISNNFFDDIDNCKKAVRWLIEDKLKWDGEQVCKNFKNRTLIDNGLSGLCRKYNGSTYDILNMAYHNEFLPWEISYAIQNFWDNPDNCAKAVRWLIECKLKWNREQICENFEYRLLLKHGLGGRAHKFKCSPYAILNNAYPNEYLPWELTRTCLNFWDNVDNIRKAIKWLVEVKMKYSKEQAYNKLTIQDFRSAGLWYVKDKV